MSYHFPVTFDQDILKQYREELQWTNQEIEMLAINLERHPDDMSNVEQLRQIIQESWMSSVKLDLIPISESLEDVLKGIDLLLDWQIYPVRMTEFILSLFDRIMLIATEVEETQQIDMRKTQAILVALQFIILVKNEQQVLPGIEEAIISINTELAETGNSTESEIEIELFGDEASQTREQADTTQPKGIDIFVPELSLNPLEAARDFIDDKNSENCMQVLNNVTDDSIQHTNSHTRFVMELALTMNFCADEAIDGEALLRGISMHDIALSSIPFLLNKNGSYTQDEINELKLHPVRSAEISRHMSQSEEAELLILHHHERVDGTGYPYGLTGNHISEQGKLAAIVDSFHDFIERNSNLSPKKRLLRAIYEININSGKRFDASWVKEFNNTMRKCWLADWNGKQRNSRLASRAA